MTGKSNATKDKMIAAVRQKGFNPETDNEAGAIAIMLVVLRELIGNHKKTDKSVFLCSSESWERADHKTL